MKSLKLYALGVVVAAMIAVITMLVRTIDERGYERGRTEHVKSESAKADSVYQVAKDSIAFLKLVVAERDSDLAHVHVETNRTVRGARKQVQDARAALEDSAATIAVLRTELRETSDTLEAVLARIPVERDAASAAVTARDTVITQQDTAIVKADTAIAKKEAVVATVEKAGKNRGKLAKIGGAVVAGAGVVWGIVKLAKRK